MAGCFVIEKLECLGYDDFHAQMAKLVDALP
jgi:hypothetical protein